MTNDLNRNFTKKEAWMANKPMERCAASFAIREMKKSLPPIIYQNGYKEQGSIRVNCNSSLPRLCPILVNTFTKGLK